MRRVALVILATLLAAHSVSAQQAVRVTSSTLPSGASTSGNQTTLIGHVDGIEGLLATIDSVLDSSLTSQQATESGIGTLSSAVDLTATAIKTLLVDPTGAALDLASDAVVGDPAVTSGPQIVGKYSASALTTVTDGDAQYFWLTSGGALNIADGGGSITVDGSISCSNCSGSGASDVEGSSYTLGTDSVAPLGAYFDDVSPTAATENQIHLVRMTSARALHTSVRDALPAGDNDIGNVDLELAGNAASVGNGASGSQTLRVTIASDSSGTLSGIGNISTSVTPGTGATHLGKAIGGAVGATDTGVAALAQRDDVLTALSDPDGDYVPRRVNAYGAQWAIGDLCGSDAVQSADINLSAGTGNTEIVALSGSTVIYVCGFNWTVGGDATVQWITGTGTACATGETDKETFTTSATIGYGIANPNNGSVQFKGAAGEALCVERSASVALTGRVTYVQR